MENYSFSEKVKLYTSGLIHTMRVPDNCFDRMVVGSLIVYYIFGREALTFLHGLLLGFALMLLSLIIKAWHDRATQWCATHSWFVIDLTVNSERRTREFWLNVPPEFPRDEKHLARLLYGIH